MLGRLFFLVALFGSVAITFADPLSLNLPQTLDPVKADLASGGTDQILVLGDSLTARQDSYSTTFRADLQAAYGDAGYGWVGGNMANFSSGPGSGYGAVNGDSTPHQSLDGLWNDLTGTAYSFITPQDATSETIYYATHTGGTTVTPYYIGNNGVPQYLSSFSTVAGSNGVASQTIAVPTGYSDQHIYYYVQSGGDFDYLGTQNSNSTPGVVVNTAANGGWGVENFLQRDYTFDGITQAVSPKLVMIFLGQNDQGETESKYAGLLQQLIDRVKRDLPNAQILLVSTYDNGSDGLPPIVAGTEDIAEADGLGYINLYEAGGDAVFLNSQGFFVDGIHTTPAGGEYFGNMLASAFLTDGASLVPEPASTALLIAPLAIAILSRRRPA